MAHSSKVLFVSGLQIHPTISGGTLRSFGLATALRRHGFDVCVHSLTGRKADYQARRPSSVQFWPDGTPEHVDRSVTSAIAWLGGFVAGLPPVWISAQLAAAATMPGEMLLPSALRDKLKWCDAIVADFPFVSPIFLAPSASGKLRVLSTHNVAHHLHGQDALLTRLIRALVRDIEIRAVEACDILVSCCADDGRFFETHANVRKGVVVPNGVDLPRFAGIESQRADARRELGVPDPAKLFLFTASQLGPNREAFAYLQAFARSHEQLLVERGIHIAVVGNVAAQPLRLPGFTATGGVDRLEPYFAAADAAINPIESGSGTNVKMGEFIAARLPILSTPFGARGFRVEHGKTGFLFDREGLAPVLASVRRLFDEDPARLRRMAVEAYAQNESLVDMDVCVQGLVDAMWRKDSIPPPVRTHDTAVGLH